MITKVDNVGRGSKVWKYNNEDLEDLLGISRRKLKTLEKMGSVDRGSLRSLFHFLVDNGNPKRNDWYHILREEHNNRMDGKND